MYRQNIVEVKPKINKWLLMAGIFLACIAILKGSGVAKKIRLF
jgi:hypothetical protein